jgi:DNA-binding MarR family transcriptional regulator
MINHDPDITRLLDRLERRRLVQRRRAEKDRRVITARIAPAGLDLLKTLDRPVEDFNRRLMVKMSERQLKSLLRLLELTRTGSRAEPAAD